MADRPVVVAVGELLAEFVAVGPDGRLARGAPRLWAGPFPSGAPGIFCDQAARCGARAHMVGGVGRDAFGRAVLDRLRGAGADVSGVRVDPGRPTGAAHVAYREDGSRSFVFHLLGTAAERLGATEALDGPGAVLHVSGASLGSPALREAILAAADRASALSVDPNVRPELMGDPAARRALEALLARARYATPSEEDMAHLRPGEDPEAAAAALGPDVVALTLGDRGAVLLGGGGRVMVPAVPVEAVDPTGAGDGFAATLVVMLERGVPLAAAGALAARAGARAAAHVGPMEGNAAVEPPGVPGAD